MKPYVADTYFPSLKQDEEEIGGPSPGTFPAGPGHAGGPCGRDAAAQGPVPQRSLNTVYRYHIEDIET